MGKSICTKCGSFDENCCGSSGQSASSGAAGCRPDADQGIRYAVIRYERPMRFEDSIDVVAQGMIENPAVARVPATPGFDELALAITEDMEKTQKVIRDFDDGGDIDDESDDYLAGVLDGLDQAMKLLDKIRQTNKTNRT